jgi:iron complex transport system substrate-binding protein
MFRTVTKSSRRAVRLGTAAAASAVLLVSVAACGSDQGSGSKAESTKAAGAGGDSTGTGFPVTIKHKFGETVVKKDSKRIVTVGLTDQDSVLALGKVPVATTNWLGTYKGNIGPWAADKAKGAPTPAVLKTVSGGPEFEKIAAQRPDLILALYAGLTSDQYKKLSKIAPVVAQPKDFVDYGITWQRQTETIGKALGKPAEAKKLVAATEKHISDAAAKHPEFKGATAVTATPYEGIFVYGPQDNRSRLMTDLGFKLPAELGKVVGDEFGKNLSREKTEMLDNDAMVWFVTNDAKDEAKLHKNGVYKGLDVVKDGREVYINDQLDFGKAASFVSPLSLPYTVDRLVPMLADAVDGKPATKVKSPKN